MTAWSGFSAGASKRTCTRKEVSMRSAALVGESSHAQQECGRTRRGALRAAVQLCARAPHFWCAASRPFRSSSRAISSLCARDSNYSNILSLALV